jgi:hypothetical protein
LVSRSFDNVDFKLAEADFFLEKVQSSSLELFECNFYFSAFLSAARSVTFALQAVMAEVNGFPNWYAQQQEVLRTSETAQNFKNLRNEALKTGDLPVTGGSFKRGKITLFLTLPDGRSSADQVDAVAAATDYMRRLVKLVFDCYVAFGPVIDPEQHYSAGNLERTGRTIDDVDEELFGIRGWTSGIPDAERLRLLRQSLPGCRIDHLFERYLGESRPRPS